MAEKSPALIKIKELLLWKKKILNAKYANLPSSSGRPNPICINGGIYTQICSPNIVAAIDSQTGDLLWRNQVGRHGAECLTIVSGKIYTRTDLDQICLNAETGEVLWTYRPDGAFGEMFYGLPAVTNNRLYTGDTKGAFHCVNAATGELVWKRQLSTAGHMINGNPVVVGDKVIVGSNIPNAVALNRYTGEVEWRRRLDSSSIGNAIKHGTNVLISSCQTLYELRAKDGAVVYKWRRKGWDIRKFLLYGDSIILHIQAEYKAGTRSASANPPCRILSLLKREIVWEIEAPEFSTGITAIKARKLLCVSGFGKLNMLSATTGRLLYKINAGSIGSGHYSNPDSCDGNFYVQSFNGIIFAAAFPAVNPVT